MEAADTIMVGWAGVGSGSSRRLSPLGGHTDTYEGRNGPGNKYWLFDYRGIEWDDKLWWAGLMIQVHTASRCHSRGGECHMLESLYPLELQVNYCISGVPETT